MGELGADRRADRAERGDERREQSALEREKMAAERHTALVESNRRDALESLDINLREKREKEERDRAQKDMDANMNARLRAEALGLGPIPEDASTEGIMRLVGVTQSNKEQIATAEKRYNDLQERLIDYTSRIDIPTPDQSNVIRQLNDESKAALAHLTELRQIVQSGGAEQSPQRAPLPVPRARASVADVVKKKMAAPNYENAAFYREEALKEEGYNFPTIAKLGSFIGDVVDPTGQIGAGKMLREGLRKSTRERLKKDYGIDDIDVDFLEEEYANKYVPSQMTRDYYNWQPYKLPPLR
jgi:hypothetical protein